MFAKDAATGVPCDAEGRPFSGDETATCVLFAAMSDARAFCEGAVARHPSVRFDVFDANGRVLPPLMTVMHPDCAAALDTSPAQMRRRRRIAIALAIGGLPLTVYACFDVAERILPALIGINMLLFAGRLAWMNLALRETERVRESRVAEALRAERRQP